MAGQDFVVDPSFFEDEEQGPALNYGDIARRLGAFGIRGAAGVGSGLATGLNVIPGLGVAAGAGVGAAGETLAQMLENASLNPSKLNKSAIAAAGAIGAVPGAALIKQGKMGLSALRSAGMGYASTAAMKGTQDNPETGKKEIFENPNKVLNPAQWSGLDIAGLGVAGGVGALGGRMGRSPETKAAAAAAKAERDAKNAGFKGEHGGKDFQWGKTVYKSRKDAEDIAQSVGGQVAVEKDGYHVVPGDYQPASAKKTALSVSSAKKAKERIEELRKQNAEGVLDEAHSETITAVDPETGVKIVYKRKLDTPTNKKRQDAIARKKEGLEPKNPTVTERFSAVNPETAATETASQSFGKPEPKKADGLDELLGGGSDDAESVLETLGDTPVEPAAPLTKPTKGKNTVLNVGRAGKKKAATVEDLNLKVDENGSVVPTTGTPEPPDKEPMRKSSRFYKENKQILDDSIAAREQELAGMPDPEMSPMALSENASPELKAQVFRAQKLRDLYRQAQDAFKRGEVGDEVPAAAATMKQGMLDNIDKMENAETASLLQKDLDDIAAGKLEVEGANPARAGGEDVPQGALESTDSKYDYTQPAMTMQEVAEATDTPMDTLNKLVKSTNPDKKLDTIELLGGRRVPLEWLNEWIALGNGGPGKRGRPPLSGQKGEINPALFASMGSGALGGLTGAQYDEENPLRGALVGAALGAAAPYGAKRLYDADLAGLTSNLGGKVHEVGKTIPDVIRSNFLSDFDSIIANSAVGPAGSGLWAGVEKSLAGDPRGKRLLKEMVPWLQDMYDNVKNRRAADFIAEAERGEMLPGESTNIVQEIMSYPSELMAAGDLTTYNAARRSGFSPGEAKRITLQSQDLNYPINRNIINWNRTKTPEGRTSFAGKILLPFKNTAANILDSGFDRLPFGLNILANQFGKDASRRDSLAESSVKTGVGSGIFGIAYMMGRNADPQNAAKWRKYVSNFAGPYSMVANAGFSAGLAGQQGDDWKGQAFDAGMSGIGDFPLPTTRIPQEILKTGLAFADGSLTDPGLHPELEGPARYLPKGFYPGIAQNFYDWTVGSQNSGEDFGVGGLIRNAVRKATESEPEDDPFSIIE